MHFSSLRIHGFKSFADKTELDISPGLNGIVGPNGCGKSNVVEALRWVMGEGSAKRMRGSGMEDVIFGGTTARAPRNVAEVSLMLDNRDRRAPAAYNGQDQIEVTRRIERDRGSAYKINGKPVRARDVQMLFADSASGANSPAIVSQGRVTELIKAKPMERRLILEDSAGISGLFVRRHEAELKLRAAETNMQRLEDVLGSMESRLSVLKKQARQAEQYRNLNTQIRQLDVNIAALDYRALEDKITEIKRLFADSESRVAEYLTSVTQLTKTQNTQSQDLPALRQAEAEAAAALQRANIELQTQEEAAQRAIDMAADLVKQLQDITEAQAHETTNLEETQSLLESLLEEQTRIAEDQKDAESQYDLFKAECVRLEGESTAQEERYNTKMQGVAESKARKDALVQQAETNQKRMEVLQQRLSILQDELHALHDSNAGADSVTLLAEMQAELTETQGRIIQDEAGLMTLSDDITRLSDMDAQLLEQKSAAEQALGAHKAEITILQQFFTEAKDEDGSDFEPLLHNITAYAGFEKALSRALGDTLMAALDPQAPIYWMRTQHSNPPMLPGGVMSLLGKVDAPESLRNCLGQVGIVDNAEDGDRLMSNLAVGQSLVSADGELWRWDGLRVKADAPDHNVVTMEHKTKLKALLADSAALESAAGQAAEAYAGCQRALQDARKQKDEHSLKLGAARAQLQDLQTRYTRQEADLQRVADQRQNITDRMQVITDDIATLDDVMRWDADRLHALEADQDGQLDTDSLEAMRNSLHAVRSDHQDALRTYDQFCEKQRSVQARLQAIGDERVNTKNRNIRAQERLKTLAEQHSDVKAKQAVLADAPKQDENSKQVLLDTISTAETARKQHAERLASAENALHDTHTALKTAEAQLGDAREARAHAQATLTSAQEQLEAKAADIQARFQMPAQDVIVHAAVNMDEDHDLPAMRGSRDDLMRQRERIGAVNLRAEEELDELNAEAGALFHERDDLRDAIDELRSAIETINTEARTRLMAAFTQVNSHFKQLFETLFAGGKAHLALTESDDPLDAGLEIFAQPPGKSLQSLSLLSGGEQTMASIALIFAMFLTSPSPICVLDEIDAPLDDSNVDRVCALLEDIVQRSETRFIIVTHHRMTMARMDRLYGVTMQEKGVSSLVSVDLQQSFNFAEAA